MHDDRIDSMAYLPPQPAETAASTADVVVGDRPLAQTLKSLAIGFVAGVAFWHLIGFWSFVGDVAFNRDPGPPRAAQLVEVPASSATPAATSEGATTITGGDKVSSPVGTTAGLLDANCSALALDRKSGTVRAAPCTPSRLMLVDAGARERQDLAVADLIERQLAERLGLSASRIETGSVTVAD